MPFVAAPGVAALDVIWKQESETVENTFHYHKGSAWDLASLEDLCNTYIGWAGTNASIFGSWCGFVKCYARDLSAVDGASVEMNSPTDIPGTGGGAALPNNATWALKRLTGLAGRKNRGRIYLIGVSTSWLTTDKQSITASVAAIVKAAYDGLMTAQLSDNSATEVILHRSAGTSTPVIYYGWSDLFLDSQRRRLPGHNRHH